MASLLTLVVAALLPCALVAIPINNGIDGEPEVQCGPTSVQISFSSSAPFEGTVYAKNHFAQDECRTSGDGATAGGGIEIGFDQCNSLRQRSIEPRGVFVSLTVVVQFHRAVLTKVDRAFNIRCFYMEADKTVDADLEVAMITTELVTLTVPMPVCRYDICASDESGQLLGGECQPVAFALIGQKIVHKWTCDSETLDTFCMEVYDCYVDDQQGGEPLSLIDQAGCSLDGNLVPNPSYPMDLMAQAPSHVFKWADRPALYFNCQVRIGIKEPGANCDDWRAQSGVCQPEPLSLGRKKRSVARRSLAARSPASQPGALEMDLAPSRPVYVADLELSQADIPAALLNPANPAAPAFGPSASAPAQGVCLSTNQVGSMFALVALLFVVATGLSAAVFLRRSKD